MEYKNMNQIPTYPEYSYDNADEIDKDVDYMKELYPKATRAIQREVDEECDKLEYDGSCMFDEYPSCEHLETIVDAIYDRIVSSNPNGPFMRMEQVSPPRQPNNQQLPPWGPPPRPPVTPPSGPARPPMNPVPPPMRPNRPSQPSRPDYNPDGSPDWLRNLISVLLYNEMLHRRRRYRRRKRPYRSF